MNRHEATLYFTKELNKHGYVKIIYSPLMQSRLEKLAMSFELTDEHNSSISVNMWGESDGDGLTFGRSRRKTKKGIPRLAGKNLKISLNDEHWQDELLLLRDITKTLAEKELIKQTKEANYIFIEKDEELVHKDNGEIYVHLRGTPLAIITDREVSLLKEIYKGDLSDETREAAQVFGFGKELEVDYKKLAKDDPSKFCEYFEAVSTEKKSSVLKDIWTLIDKGKLDDEIKSLLREKYHDLALDVGRDKLKDE